MLSIEKIKVIVWDVDGTWYRFSNGLIGEEIDKRCAVISEVLNIPFDKAKELEEETVKKVKSHTKAVSIITGLSINKVLDMVQSKIDRAKFLGKDEKLSEMFEKLSWLKHGIVSNMRMQSLLKTMDILGVDRRIFDFIILPEETGVTKPDLKPFMLALQKTGLEPSEHLFVGDREEVDIVPAKKVGMQTCYVWGESEIADTSISNLYEIVELLARH